MSMVEQFRNNNVKWVALVIGQEVVLQWMKVYLMLLKKYFLDYMIKDISIKVKE